MSKSLVGSNCTVCAFPLEQSTPVRVLKRRQGGLESIPAPTAHSCGERGVIKGMGATSFQELWASIVSLLPSPPVSVTESQQGPVDD